MDSLEKENLSGLKTVMTANIPIEFHPLIKQIVNEKNMSQSEVFTNALKDYIEKVLA